MILPGDQIGVLGGGQLGMFFTAAAKRMGYRVAVWDPDPQAPARSWADTFIGADFDDPQATRSFLSETKGVTYEWENIPARLVEMIEKEVTVHPGSRVLCLLQNRISQKRFLSEQGLPIAPFHAFQDPKALPRLAEELGLPCICKTATAGYDGHGQWRLERSNEVTALSGFLQDQPHPTGWIVEKRVPYLKELSILVVQGEHGSLQTYPIAENWHENGILRMSRVPAEIDPDLVPQIIFLASRAVTALGEAGVFCVEMFLMNHGEVLINEIAPRPHNSGHYTMDVCSVSQFEQQVRALCGLPLITPQLLSAAVLINILGHEIELLHSPEGLMQLLSIQGTRIYHYRKQAVRTGRKMGHVLLTDPEPRRAMEQAQTVLKTVLKKTGQIYSRNDTLPSSRSV